MENKELLENSGMNVSGEMVHSDDFDSLVSNWMSEQKFFIPEPKLHIFGTETEFDSAKSLFDYISGLQSEIKALKALLEKHGIDPNEIVDAEP